MINDTAIAIVKRSSWATDEMADAVEYRVTQFLRTYAVGIKTSVKLTTSYWRNHKISSLLEFVSLLCLHNGGFMKVVLRV